jgi:hypothetical protein
MEVNQNPINLNIARVKNNDFGETNGTVKLMCTDAEGHTHIVYSRNPVGNSTSMSPSIAAQVFFQRDVDLGGSNTLVATGGNPNKPLWFIFWKEGGVIDILNDINYAGSSLDMRGATNSGTNQISIHSAPIMYLNSVFEEIEFGTLNNKFKFGTDGGHAKGVIGTIIHEKYHKSCNMNWSLIGVTSSTETDGDGIPNAEEDIPGTLLYPGSNIFPKTDKNKSDTYSFSGKPNASGYATYADQEIRCRVIQYNAVTTAQWQTHYFSSKDWSAHSDNQNW